MSDKYTIEDAPVKQTPAYTVESKEPSLGEGMAHASVLRNISEGLGHLADWAEQQRNRSEVSDLSKEAKGEATGGTGAGYDLLARASKLLSGATDPKSVLTMAGIALANTNPWTGIPVDAALVAHGSYTAAKNAPAAVGGNPEAAQNALLGLSEAASGGAGTAAQVKAAPAALANFKKMLYSGKVAPDGTPELSSTAQSILHPSKMPENALRGLIAPPEEVIAQMKAQRAEQFQSEFDKQYGAFNEAKAANAAKMDEQIKLAEAIRQKEITDMARLQTQQGAESSAAIRRQGILDLQASKNAPQPSPLAGATSSAAPVSTPAALPAPGGTTSTTGAAIPQGNLTPFVSKFTPQTPPRIVTPENPAPPINRTLVSYDAPTLVKMAKAGDIDALTELIRNPRGVDVASAVPNSRYLLEANRPTNIYGGPQR